MEKGMKEIAIETVCQNKGQIASYLKTGSITPMVWRNCQDVEEGRGSRTFRAPQRWMRLCVLPPQFRIPVDPMHVRSSVPLRSGFGREP